MSVGYYHSLCRRYRGRAVEIRMRDGRVHRGIIHRVTGDRVYLRPLGPRRNFGGYGYGYYGWGWGGFGAGLAIGAIAGIALVGAFWL
ncbi:hypothetical protein DZB84_23160 [Bacillus sp. HNG]|uniref:hypothetical protein n=1 Tax=Bacillus sp. HNG TaxID=2293325 RepID=UPI000E2F948C|nr:hypothetical protein [Bacillus sp. HNG]RFB10185.1 hypothetical protein DZB84_23160 [Bacillus sp. HNG]